MRFVEAKGVPGELMIVGDYPTKEEYISGISFGGSAARALRFLFSPYARDVNIENVFKTHYVKIPIPGFNSKNKKKATESLNEIYKIANWDSMIADQIEAANPNMIIAMGELACWALTGQTKVQLRRGSIYQLKPTLTQRSRNVLVTLSLRDIYRENEVPFSYVQWDIGKAVKYRYLKTPFQPSEVIWIPKTITELENWWERAKKAEFLTFDIETHHGYVTCIGFSHDGHEAISVPLLFCDYGDVTTRGLFYKKIKEILSSGIPLVNQNIKYDWTVLEKWGFEVKNIVGDTMLMAHTIYSELPKDLGFLSSIYTDQPYYKDEGKEYNPRQHSPQKLLIYNAKDALVTHQIWKLQQDDAAALGVRDFFYNNVMRVFPIYKQIEDRGLLVDKKKHAEIYDKYRQMYSEYCAFINTIAEERINPRSPTQSARLLYDTLKCNMRTHITPSGATAPSTDNKVILELLLEADEATKIILNKFLIARKLSKIIEYLEIPIGEDNRLRTSIKLHGTETGRTSGGKSLDRVFRIENNRIVSLDVGMTLQNIPKHGYNFGDVSIGKDLRTIFIPTPGYVFVEGDQSQAEARVVCVLADDLDTLKLFDTSDIHKVTASWIYGKPVDAITPEERQIGKKARHAGNYNISSRELAHQLQRDPKECKLILDKFHQASPKVRVIFHAEIRKAIDKQRCLISPHGRRREFFGRVSEDMYKEGYSTIPQATVADHTKFTMLVKMYERYKPPLAYPVAESHDSLLFEVRKEIYKEFIDSFEEAIKTPINFSKCTLSRDFDLVIPGEIELGEISWGELVRYR